MHVLVTEHMVNSYGGQMRAVAPGIEFIQLAKDRSFSGPVEQAEVACMSTDMFPSNLFVPLIQQVPNMAALRWFHSFAVGVDHPIFREIHDRGVTLTNSAGVTAVPIAQYVLGMMLRHARAIDQFEAAQRERAWRRVEADELTGRTVAILGVGGIGSEVARLARAFEMRVLGMRRNPVEMEHVELLLPPDRLHDLLAEADYIVVACPLSEQTRGMLDAAAFASMRPNAYIVNVARGPIIAESAMLDALRENRIAGAALDVFDEEPLPADSPLWTMPNVIISPHASSISPRTLDRGARMFIDNLRRYAAGEPLKGVVDFAVEG